MRHISALLVILLLAATSFPSANGREQPIRNILIIRLERAAIHSSIVAEYDLGVSYEHGEGVRRNLRKAWHWYKEAAAQGDTDAENNLGVMCVLDPTDKSDDYRPPCSSNTLAAKWFRKAASGGNAYAEFNLGLMQANGEMKGEAFQPHSFAAARWWNKAAAQGDGEAACQLGSLYEYREGHGFPKSLSLAKHWYDIAVERGNADAETSLGVMYFVGKGVAQDRAAATSLFRRAAVQGNSYAQDDLAWVFFTDGARHPAIRWWRQAAVHGSTTARTILAQIEAARRAGSRNIIPRGGVSNEVGLPDDAVQEAPFIR